MTSFTVMGWNLLNCGIKKYNASSGGAFLDVIVEAFKVNNVGAAGLSEILSNVADPMGKELVSKLKKATGSAWAYQASPQFGVKRKEQYLMLWDTKLLTAVNFAHQFRDPSSPRRGRPRMLGFPTQLRDRPPYVGHFTEANPPKSRSARKLAIAVMHSPGPGTDAPKTAAQTLAQVVDLTDPDEAAALLGDFNINRDVNAGRPGTNGAEAFGPLIGVKFEQPLWKGPETSLPVSIRPQPILGDCLSNPYDQVFTRTGSGVSFPDAAAENLLDETQRTGSVSKRQGYLEQVVAALERAWAGSGPAGYATLDLAFWAYRWYVSDHIPVVVDVEF